METKTVNLACQEKPLIWNKQLFVINDKGNKFKVKNFEKLISEIFVEVEGLPDEFWFKLNGNAIFEFQKEFKLITE